MKERELISSLLTDQEKKEILKAEPTKLMYKFSDYEYNTNLKQRIVSGLNRLDYMLKGFELGCITLWSGVTNCLDKDTEYFNGKQWKKISDYTVGDKVLQYNADGTATLNKPLRYIKQKCDEFLKLETKALDMVVTRNHNIVYKVKNKLYKKTAEEISSQHESSKNGFSGKIITTFNYSGKGIKLTDEQIRVMCMVICDGSFRKDTNTNYCCINIKKTRKIERAEKLLINADIKYKKYQNKIGYTRFYFHAPIKTKIFDKYWYNCTNSQLQIIADEVMYWDGSKLKCNDEFSANNEQNIDFVQFAFEAVGIRANKFQYDRRGFTHKNGKYIRKSMEYKLVISKRKNALVSIRNSHNKNHFESVKPGDGYCYCFTMPSGMLVVRRNGKIMITGNSGKTAMLTLIARETIKQGNKVFFFNGEQTKDDFKNNLYKSSVTSKDIIGKRYMTTDIYDYYVKPDKVKELDRIYGNNLFVFNNNMKRDIDTLLLAMEQAYNLGVRCFILDNFMQIDIDSDNIYQEQSKIMEKLRTFAVNREVHIHLVAHPRKIENFQTRLSLFDVAGSMNIPNKAYNIISIIRVSNIVKDSPEYVKLKYDLGKDGYNIGECDGILEILKTKGNATGLIGLKFDNTLKTYTLVNQMTSEVKERYLRQLEEERNPRKKGKDKENCPF